MSAAKLYRVTGFLFHNDLNHITVHMPPHKFQVRIDQIELAIESTPELFSPRRLDSGTRAMLKCVSFSSDDRVLDLGCGCGIVGIYAAKLVGEKNVCLLDSDPKAIEYATRNAAANAVPSVSITLSDGFKDFGETDFTQILCNPPYHADFAVPKQFIMKGFNRLRIGGQMHFVTKRDTWYRNKIRAVFGGVRCQKVDGYFVISATKRRDSYAKRK